MNIRKQIAQVMNFEKPARIPALEWGPWWSLTVKSWQKDLPPGIPNARWASPGMAVHPESGDIGDYLGLDPFRVIWLGITGPGCPSPAEEGAGLIANREDYHKIKKYLYPDPDWIIRYLRQLQDEHDAGNMAFWLYIEGFFWGPRKLLGITGHLLAFYDQPELIKEINEDILAYYQKILPEIFAVATPDVLLISEDLSYNHGPMLSEELFDLTMAPYYEKLTKLLYGYKIKALVDSDGDVLPIIPWLTRCGVDGIGPLERMAHVDVAQIRELYPRLILLGGFDKTVMCKGETAMRNEFERLLPVIGQGGFLPMPDHQTPPDVSVEQYLLFRRLFDEYCQKALAL